MFVAPTIRPANPGGFGWIFGVTVNCRWDQTDDAINAPTVGNGGGEQPNRSGATTARENEP